MQKKIETGTSKFMLVDDLSPEDLAMLQALYSRSAESAEVHLEKVAKSGSGKFMERFYVGYGHKSIADCGSTTLFIEGVSTLAAKAVQDWPLYSGQETSTRYIDMSKQRIEDPVGTSVSRAILDRWMEFYTTSQGAVEATIRERYPQSKQDSEAVAQRLYKKALNQLSDDELAAVEKSAKTSYEGAVKARVFDSLRGFLPAGVTTQLSWHTNLRQAGDHLVMLSKHPSKEIRDIGTSLQKLLGETYTSSGMGMSLASVSGVGTEGGTEAQDARRRWEQTVADTYSYFDDFSSSEAFETSIHRSFLTPFQDIIQSRPRGCVLPHFMTDLGQLHFSFPLDFGSFRDLQRHRNGVCRMPLLTTDHEFEPWYIEQLGNGLDVEALNLIDWQTAAIKKISDDPVVRQYYTALGFRVPCFVTFGLPAAVYVMELRSGKTIHPTLRRVIHRMIGQFRNEFPEFPLHVDMDPDDWSVRRGMQTITQKPV